MSYPVLRQSCFQLRVPDLHGDGNSGLFGLVEAPVGLAKHNQNCTPTDKSQRLYLEKTGKNNEVRDGLHHFAKAPEKADLSASINMMENFPMLFKDDLATDNSEPLKYSMLSSLRSVAPS